MRVLTVGPYERDNFGDLLFLLVTKQYLTETSVIPAAPFAADMTSLLGCQVHAYGPLLDTEEFDVIWTVGGEVGGVSIGHAYRMSAPSDEYETFQRSLPWECQRIISRAVGDAPIITPYIPAPLLFPLNAGTMTVLNSVGLSNILGPHMPPVLQEEYIGVLRDASHISVRDIESSHALEALGINHQLSPDAVHALGRLWPAKRIRNSDVAIVQIKETTLSTLGIGTVAEALARCRGLRRLRIRLLLAGTSLGHDSVRSYEELIKQLRRISPGINVAIVDDTRPFDRVNQIRQARIVIGTSLHVRIVSSAYEVPRVSLTGPKTARYAKFWDPEMPFDVALGDLDEAIEVALSKSDEPSTAEASQNLTNLAHQNLSELAAEVGIACSAQTFDDKIQRMRTRRKRRSKMNWV